jgi:hypothetical protein
MILTGPLSAVHLRYHPLEDLEVLVEIHAHERRRTPAEWRSPDGFANSDRREVAWKRRTMTLEMKKKERLEVKRKKKRLEVKSLQTHGAVLRS